MPRTGSARADNHEDDADPTPQVELAEFITSLREQLRATRSEQADDIGFTVGPVELELTLSTRREIGGEAMVRIYVMNAGASAKRSNEVNQRVKFTLTPVDLAQGSRELQVSDYVTERPR